MKTLLLRTVAFIIKFFGVIIGIPGMAITFIGLFLTDLADTTMGYAEKLK